MTTRSQPDAIDTRLIYLAYAGLAGLSGFVLFGWGPMWLGSDYAGEPWAKAAAIRVVGAALMAAACLSGALAEIEEPRSSHRGLFWMGLAHTVVFFVVLTQRIGIWGPGLADRALELLLVVAAVFFYLWQTVEGHRDPKRSPPLSIFADKKPKAKQPLRSQYEEKIRQAASQEERNRLARDLHDSVKQQIFVIQTAAATAQARFESDTGGAKEALDQVRKSAREAMTEMQVMLDQLRAKPLENVGLVEALKEQCEALGFRTGAQVDFTAGKLPPSETLAPGAQEAIFRVVQEALANVGRHARAVRVAVSIGSAGGDVVLTIRDDGAGFDPEEGSRGMGIANMRARAEELRGRLKLESQPGNGTSLTLFVPYVVQAPKKYGRRALSWALFMVVHGAMYVRNDGVNAGGFLVFAAIGAIAFARETVAYVRTRKNVEVTL